jgi:hypothetical protein
VGSLYDHKNGFLSEGGQSRVNRCKYCNLLADPLCIDDTTLVDENNRVYHRSCSEYVKPAPTGEVGVKHDADKIRYSLLPPGVLKCVVETLEHGARKYTPDNWKKVLEGPDGETRYYDAAMRHIEAWRCGEALDTESGKPHLAHAVSCLLFLLYSDLKKHAKTT